MKIFTKFAASPTFVPIQTNAAQILHNLAKWSQYAPPTLLRPSKMASKLIKKRGFMAWIFFGRGKAKIHGMNLFFWGKKTPLESPERVSPAKIPSKTLPKSINFAINFGPSSQLCRKCGFWKKMIFHRKNHDFRGFEPHKISKNLAKSTKNRWQIQKSVKTPRFMHESFQWQEKERF